MSKWEGKFIIGLTGNIATGKSVVRKMLEHLGAYGIDADALSHRAIAKGAPGFDQVVKAFGKYILGDHGEIDRGKLGKLVFSDPQALTELESIIHPLVRQAVEHLVMKTSRKVVVIEAIKLIESPLKEACDTIWVTTAPEIKQLTRLGESRGMDAATAAERMKSQSSQEDKKAAADTVIENGGSFDDTWEQVRQAWRQLFPEDAKDDSAPEKVAATITVGMDELVVLKARPRQAEEIAAFITRMSGGKQQLTRMDVMAEFGEKAYLLLMSKDQLVGLVGWKVEDLVARTDEIYLEEGLSLNDTVPFLISEMEKASRELQCEASLVFVSPQVAQQVAVWSGLGYEARGVESLTVNAWKDAAKEYLSDETILLFKQLRVDRVLKPI